MNITEKILEDLLTKSPEENEENKQKNQINILNFQYSNISKINLNHIHFEKIEYLSLKNNRISDINFISSFPFLWYLDIRENYIENFKALEQKGTLGFLAFTLGKLFHCDFFNLKNINIAYLVIDGDYDCKGKLEQFVYNEANNVIYCKENVVLFKDRVSNKHFDLHKFMAFENYDIVNYDEQENVFNSNSTAQLFSSLSGQEKLKKFQSFILFYNRKIRSIMKSDFNIQVPNKTMRAYRSNSRRFTTILNTNLSKSSLFTKVNDQSTKKFMSNNKILKLNAKDFLSTAEKSELNGTNTDNNTDKFFNNKNNNNIRCDLNKKNENEKIINNYFNNNAYKSKASHSIRIITPSHTAVPQNKKLQTEQKKLINDFHIVKETNEKMKENEEEKVEDRLIIDAFKLDEIEMFAELETKKLEMLFLCYENFINVPLSEDFANIINGFEVFSKNNLKIFVPCDPDDDLKYNKENNNNFNDNDNGNYNEKSPLIKTENIFDVDLNKNLANNKIKIKKQFKNVKVPKYSVIDFCFFSNLKLYKEINPIKINESDKCELSGIITCLGFDYTIFFCEDSKEQLAILDILLLNVLGILKASLAYKLLEFLIFKNFSKEKIKKSNVNNNETYQESNKIRIQLQSSQPQKNQTKKIKSLKSHIKKALSLYSQSTQIYLSFINFLIESLKKKQQQNQEAIKNLSDTPPSTPNSENFLRELETRKIHRLALSANTLKNISSNFQSNFNPEMGFAKRKTALCAYISTLAKQFKIFKALLIINQHIFDFILYKKIQDLVILEDQFAYRVFLEFRNFLFEYQDKNCAEEQQRICKSLADKQLLQYKSSTLANRFYFWRQDVSVDKVLRGQQSIFKLKSDLAKAKAKKRQGSSLVCFERKGNENNSSCFGLNGSVNFACGEFDFDINKNINVHVNKKIKKNNDEDFLLIKENNNNKYFMNNSKEENNFFMKACLKNELSDKRKLDLFNGRKDTFLNNKNNSTLMSYDGHEKKISFDVKDEENKINKINNSNFVVNNTGYQNEDENENENESSFYQIKDISEITKLNNLAVYNKLKNLKLVNLNTSSKFSENNQDSINTRYDNKLGFKSSLVTKNTIKNFISHTSFNNTKKETDIETDNFQNNNNNYNSKKKSYTSSNLPFISKPIKKIISITLNQKNILKANDKNENENENENNNKEINQLNTNNNNHFLKINENLKNLCNKNNTNERNINMLISDHNSSTKFLNQTLREMSNNHNSIAIANNESSSILSKQNIRAIENFKNVKEFSITQANILQQQLKVKKYPNSVLNLGISTSINFFSGFKKTGNDFIAKSLRAVENNVSFNNKNFASVYSSKNQLKSNGFNVNNSSRFRSVDSYYENLSNSPLKIFNSSKTEFNFPSKKIKNFDVKEFNFTKDLKNKNKSDVFTVRKKLILNRNQKTFK